MTSVEFDAVAAVMLPRAQALHATVASGDVPRIRADARQLLHDFPDDADVRGLCGAALLFCGDAAEALPYLSPNEHAARARALGALGRFDEARLELALAEAAGDPNAAGSAIDVESHANATGKENTLPVNTFDLVENELARCHREFFRIGKWGESMEILRICHDRRGHRTMGGKTLYRVGNDCPRWEGEPVDHLLLINADGSGDLLQYGRYVHEARKRCQRITLACEPILHALVRRCLPVDAVVGMHDFRPALQQADAYMTVSLLLADVLGMQYDTPWRIEPIAGTVPDLGPGRHVGLCWAASVSGKERSIPFAALAPLRSVPGVTLHSLQVGAAEGQAGPWVRRHALRTYDDTVSLIAALDAVISVDTSVAHLAGNMGKPTHLLLCPYEDWRWGTGDTTSWYPTMHLYRGSLAAAIKAIGRDLRR